MCIRRFVESEAFAKICAAEQVLRELPFITALPAGAVLAAQGHETLPAAADAQVLVQGIAILPDHFTPVELRIHVGEPVPFIIWYPGIVPDEVERYDEISCVTGGYGLLRLRQFMEVLMQY